MLAHHRSEEDSGRVEDELLERIALGRREGFQGDGHFAEGLVFGVDERGLEPAFQPKKNSPPGSVFTVRCVFERGVPAGALR